MIKHPGRWFIAMAASLAAAAWFFWRAVGTATFVRALVVMYVAGYVAKLIESERRRGARPGVLTIAMTVAASAASTWILFVMDARWWVKFLLLPIVLVAPLMVIANFCYRADVRRAQRRRDAHATHLAQAVVAGKPAERFALYLRPFVSTDRLTAQALPQEIAFGEVPVHVDVEALLARSLRATVPLIALGKSGDVAEGAGRVTVSDDDWRETVEALARHAEFIAMVPLARSGTMWELEWLKENGLLAKVLFIMPATPHVVPNLVISVQEDDAVFDEADVRVWRASAHMLDLQKEWLEVRRIAQGYGLELPPLAPVGALFTINPATGAVKEIVPLSLSTVTTRISYLRMSMARLGLLPSPKAPGDVLQEFVRAVVWGGRTLEFALVRAGDGFAVWGDAVTATRLLQRAAEARQPRPAFVIEYFQALPTLMGERLRAGDDRAAVRYTEFARLLCTDSELAWLMPYGTLGYMESLIKAGAREESI